MPLRYLGGLCASAVKIPAGRTHLKTAIIALEVREITADTMMIGRDAQVLIVSRGIMVA